MSNRIRYQKTSVEGTSESVRVYASATASYKVYLIDRPLSFKVVALTGSDESVVTEGVQTSVHKLKIAAKKALESLGVEFSKEVRIRTTATSVTPAA